MVKLLLLIFLIVFAVMGICEFVYIVRMFLYFPNTRVQNYSFIILKKGYALKQINYIWQKIRWHGDGYAAGIIAITDDIELNELIECDNFIKDKNIVLCTAASISLCEQLQGS